jgi:lipoprotein NlpI
MRSEMGQTQRPTCDSDTCQFGRSCSFGQAIWQLPVKLGLGVWAGTWLLRAQLPKAVVFLSCFSGCEGLGFTSAQEKPTNQSTPAATQQAQVVRLLTDASQALEQEEFSRAGELAQQAAAALPDNAAVQQNAAEILYLSGKAAESVPLFDRVVELAPEAAAHNWQRGIALCTVGDFERGAEQFKRHHDVNPDDVENSAWYFLCIAKTQTVEAARQTVIPSRGDGREPMMTILKMLKQEVEPQAVLDAPLDKRIPEAARPMAQFYADLYVGLYYDSLGDAEQAKKYLKRSGEYGRTGYMVRTARVYLDARFTPTPSVEPDGSVK